MKNLEFEIAASAFGLLAMTIRISYRVLRIADLARIWLSQRLRGVAKQGYTKLNGKNQIEKIEHYMTLEAL